MKPSCKNGCCACCKLIDRFVFKVEDIKCKKSCYKDSYDCDNCELDGSEKWEYIEDVEV